MNDRGLFGEVDPVRKTTTRADGYAWEPGTGPPGETCGTCTHLCAVKMARVYWKCGVVRQFWTGGAGTDVRRKSPACKVWRAGPMTEVFR